MGACAAWLNAASLAMTRSSVGPKTGTMLAP